MAAFQLASSEEPSALSTPGNRYSSDVDSDDLDTLPYPSELPRSDFLAANFDPQAYLSSLRNRHQTLEDLRSDLRQRSQLLNRELLDLVNSNYEEFLSLGGDLKGGEEKVEGVKVGLLGFQREVEGIRRMVKERTDAMGGLLLEKRGLRKGAAMGRGLLEVHDRLEELEARLGIVEPEGDQSESDEFDEEEDEDAVDSSAQDARLRRMRRHCDSYILIQRQVDGIGAAHPFLVAKRPRIDEVRKVILLDLANALRDAKAVKNSDATLSIVKMYGDLDAGADAVRVLKSG